MNEHWRVDKQGNFGLWYVDAEKATGDRWTKIDDIIKEWTKVHPLEMATHLQAVSDLQKEQANKFASSETGLRRGVEVPMGLAFQLQIVEPDLFTNKTLLHKFMKRYKGLTVCQKV